MVNNSHKEVFYNNIGSYLGLINHELSKTIPSEPLSNYIKVEGGYAFKSSDYISSGIPIVRISDFNNERIDLSNAKYYNEEEDYEKFRLHPGDVIIAMTGGTIGKLAIVQEGLGKLYLNQRVGKFKVLNDDNIQQEYVYWLARGIQNIVKNLGYGGAQPNVSNKQLETMEFPFPSKSIQRAIIQFLKNMMENNLNIDEYFNEKIETQIRTLHKQSLDLFNCSGSFISQLSQVTKLRQAILQEAVQGKLVPQDHNDEPAGELLKRIKAEKERLIDDKQIKKEKPLPAITDDEIPYELPNGWEWCRLGIVGEFINGDRGKNYPNRDEYVEDGIPWINTGHIESDGSLSNSSMHFITLEKYNALRSGKIQTGDLVYCLRGATIGKVAFVDPLSQGAIASSLMIIRLQNAINRKYAYFYLKSELGKQQIKEYDNGSAQPNLAANSVRKFLFPLPSIEEQKRIIDKVGELMSLCDRLEEQINESKDNADMLMQAVLKEAFEA